MFLLELIYFLATKKKEEEEKEVIWKCWADLSPRNDSGERRTCGSPGLAKTVSLGCKWWNTSWNPHPDVGFLLCTQGKKILLQLLIMWPLVEMNYQFTTSCVWREANCALLRQELGTWNHSCLLVYKARVRPKIHFPLCSKPFQWRVSYHLH